MRSLCAALSGDLQECNDNLDVISAVDQRMTEYHAFCEYREYLDTLNRFITIPVNGICIIILIITVHENDYGIIA